MKFPILETAWGPLISPGQVKTYTGGVICKTRAYGLLKNGHFHAVKIGRRTGILRASIDDYLASLPRAV